jgi:beta-lactam-binding protein with PASTA domain
VLFAAAVAVATIALTRDVGPDTAVVPTVVGLTRTTAAARIRAAGFVAQVERSPREGRPEVVVRQQPQPGATLSRGSIVGITVSPAR